MTLLLLFFQLFYSAAQFLQLQRYGVWGMHMIQLFAVDAHHMARYANHCGIFRHIPQHHGIGRYTSMIPNINGS